MENTKKHYFDDNWDISLENMNPGFSMDDFRGFLRSFLTDSLGKCADLPDALAQDLFSYFDSNCDGNIDAGEFERFANDFVKPLNKPVTALLVIDVQNDFIDGSLALKCCPAKKDGKVVLPVINELIESENFDLVVYTLDSHPPNHISFYDNLKHHKLSANNEKPEEDISLFDTVLFEGNPEFQQKLWPVHCVHDTWGLELHPELKVRKDSVFITKGDNPAVDSYSAFFDNMKMSSTSLHDELRKKNVTHVFVCGLAFDYCVAFTALDALNLGYPTVIIEDGTVGTDEDNIELMKATLASNSCVFSNSEDVDSLVGGKVRKVEFASILLKRFKNV